MYRQPADHLGAHVTGYWGFQERTAGAMRRREGPRDAVVIILSFGNEWSIDGESRDSFVGGLRCSQVTTEHAGWAWGIHVDLAPWAAHSALGVPMHELAATTVALDAFFPRALVEQLADASTWERRFAILDRTFARRLLDGRPASREVVWAWEELRRTHGQVRVSLLAKELGWSRKRLVARFREQIGLPPKAAARLLRFDQARQLAGSMSWGELAYTCGFADQSHLISEFRSFTGRTPETFLQDGVVTAA